MSLITRTGLHRISTIAIVTLAGMMIVVATSLVVLTSSLHASSRTLGESVASVQAVEEVDVDLLAHANASEPVVRQHIEDRLRSRLSDARRYVTTQRERIAFDAASAAVEEYLASRTGASGHPRALESAHDAVRTLVTINVSQAETAQREIERGDVIGDVIGISVGVLMVIVLVGLLSWIRSAVVRPIFDLASAMKRFADGDSTSRASDRGAAELRGMSARFNAMAETLARQHAQRLTYLAGVAHDLRNPLGALTLWTDEIDPDAPLPPEPRLRQMLAVVRRQVTRLDRMVVDLLDATQIEAGQLSLQWEIIDLRQAIRNVTDLFENTSPRHQILSQLPEEPLLVGGDLIRIEQTLTNLLSNAIKYSPQGGSVQIVARVEGANAIVAVTDQGIGIAKDEHEFVWEPFRRGQSTPEKIPGTGLGLSVSKRIVEAHGGEITVESDPGVGSTFALKLPLHRLEQIDAKHRGTSTARTY